jgi:hypothetical protein
MFLFVNFSGDHRSISQDKGRLFESLVSELVDALGFEDIEIRIVTGGKEYDLRAKAKLDKRFLVGQAKAWERQVGAKDIAEFVGSLEIEDIPKDAIGLFVSLTGFTPHGKEFLSKLRKGVKERINTIVGEQILKYLVQSGYTPLRETRQIAENTFNMRSGDTYILVSDRGNYFIQLLARPDETRPKAFCALNKEGEIVVEEEFGKEVRQRIDELRDLNFLSKPLEFRSTLDDLPGPIGPGPEGASWFEYKLPAPPEFFIGRKDQVSHFENFLREFKEGTTGLPIYQVLSPSGVGKSSFLLKIQSTLDQPACTAFQDARNFRGRVDLLYLLQEFLEASQKLFGTPSKIAYTTDEVLNQFVLVDKSLNENNAVGLIFVDQFESLFPKSDLYANFLDLVVRVAHDTNRVLFCVARRNDQPTTFDDRVELDLQRLTGLARSIELKDFSREEALELLSHLSEEINKNLRSGLVDLALEFTASGFPWLCKRVGAHICDAIVKRGITQEELIQHGIEPDELFEEDLSELDIMDREFLKDLANYLPATLDDLSQKYSGQLLTAKLKLFQDLRLVRLIGRTYDTYNDVFKEYLRTGEIPLPTKYAFRSAASTCRRELEIIIENNCESLHDLEMHSRLTIGALQNVLRELRMLGILETSKGQILVDSEAKDSYRNGNLDSLFAERVLRRNGLVPEILNRMATQDRVTLNQLSSYLREGLPVIEVLDRTWLTYARTFAGWLRFVGLIKPGGVVNERGAAVGGTRLAIEKSDIFLPSAYITQIIPLLNKFKTQQLISRSDVDQMIAYDAFRIGLLETNREETHWCPTDTGWEFISNATSRSRILADFVKRLPYVITYLEEIETTPKRHLDVLQTVLGNVGFTEETWLWRSKVLANWLEFAGLIFRKRGRVVQSTQIPLFE